MKKSQSIRRLGSILVPIVLGLFLIGCASSNTPPLNWDSRIGNFTYDQAKAELGTPRQADKLPDGGTRAEWLTKENAGTPGIATVPREGGVDQPVGPALSSLPKSEYTILTFDANGKLTKWDRVIR